MSAPAKPNLAEFFKELLTSPEGIALMLKHGLLDASVTDKVSAGQILAVLKAVCSAADAVCPVINSL